ncbi:MAG: hypothetical protein ACYDHF_06365 [Candidatus Cryosericum sp.]
MEIAIGNRRVEVTAADVLAAQGKMALAKSGLLPEEEEKIRQVFADLRTALPEKGEVHQFEVAPVDFANQWQALEWARSRGLWDGRGETLSAQLLDMVGLLMRIRSWSGFEAGGKPLECTEENKVLVFGQAQKIIWALYDVLEAQEQAEEKNSEPSQAG